MSDTHLVTTAHGLLLNILSLANRGSLYREIRKYEESLEDLTKAINLNPSFHFAKSQRGSVYCKLSKFSESLKDLEDVRKRGWRK